MFKLGRLPGVAAGAACGRRSGDSGLGSEGRDVGRKAGLAALAWLTDWLNLLAGIAGVGGVVSSCSLTAN